jgi:hypothetical protein
MTEGFNPLKIARILKQKTQRVIETIYISGYQHFMIVSLLRSDQPPALPFCATGVLLLRSTRQLTNSPTRQLASSPAHQLTNSPAHQLASLPAYQLTSSPARHLASLLTYQHFPPPCITFSFFSD